MKYLGFGVLAVCGAVVGVYLAGTLIYATLPTKTVSAQPAYVTEDYLTAPFDNIGQFNHGWQGENRAVQLQPAIAVQSTVGIE